jgi:hypothetical protein
VTSIIRIIFILLQLTLFSASPVQSADITPLELFEGANKYETEAIAEGLTETILSNVRHYLTESTFIYGPSCSNGEDNCRQNFEYWQSFEVASVDLDMNGSDEVIVVVDGVGLCGSGGCHAYILANKNYTWAIIGRFFPAHYLGVSSNISNGYSDINYKDKRGEVSYSCRFDGNFYECD